MYWPITFFKHLVSLPKASDKHRCTCLRRLLLDLGDSDKAHTVYHPLLYTFYHDEIHIAAVLLTPPNGAELAPQAMFQQHLLLWCNCAMWHSRKKKRITSCYQEIGKGTCFNCKAALVSTYIKSTEMFFFLISGTSSAHLSGSDTTESFNFRSRAASASLDVLGLVSSKSSSLSALTKGSTTMCSCTHYYPRNSQ